LPLASGMRVSPSTNPPADLQACPNPKHADNFSRWI
jgi:hypothetical protein